MKNINAEKLLSEINTFIKERDWEQFHSVKNLTMALSVESSELMEIFQWMSEADSNVVKNDQQKMVKIQDELADIFVYLLRIADRTGVDLENAVYHKMKKNIEKYPVEKARGNSKKYNEY